MPDSMLHAGVHGRHHLCLLVGGLEDQGFPLPWKLNSQTQLTSLPVCCDPRAWVRQSTQSGALKGPGALSTGISLVTRWPLSWQP